MKDVLRDLRKAEGDAPWRPRCHEEEGDDDIEMEEDDNRWGTWDQVEEAYGELAVYRSHKRKRGEEEDEEEDSDSDSISDSEDQDQDEEAEDEADDRRSKKARVQ
jgi:hypothetical protein